MSGIVYLIGAGPGDPGLLTMKGAACLAKAQVVVYDFLANPELLELAPPGAEHIYVGKKGGDHTMGQEDINKLLVKLCQGGKIVARLKGGDPYVFGRGGEEATELYQAGCQFEVVPGVTSAVAAPSYAGIPVTDRRHSTEVAFVTGHEDPTKPSSTINWASLAGMGTCVFLMGIKNLPHICKQLIAEGKSPDTPAATVRWGTTPQQESLSGTLATLPELVKQAGIKPPAITIVGGVVELKEELGWFENLPLFGKSVLVTRARTQASKLSSSLTAQGAQVIEVPTIEFEDPDDPSLMAAAIAKIESYDWLIFTSPNGVERFFVALNEAGKDARALAKAKLAAIGPATGQALALGGIKPDVMAKTFVAEGLLESLKGESLAGKEVLLPRAQEAREVLPETIRSWGADLTVVPAYKTVPPPASAALLNEALENGLDAITFTASSTVANLLKLLSPEQRDTLVTKSQSGEITVTAIGPITADTATDAGLAVHVMPSVYTIDALVDALAGFYKK